jgi:hypothetical protein
MADKVKVGTNPLKLPFPQDPQGALSKLKTGGIHAVGRVRGNKAKQEALLKTLAVIAAYAREKFEFETAQREAAKANHVAAKARTAEKLARQAQAQVDELQKRQERLIRQYGLGAEPVEAEVSERNAAPKE